MQDILSDIDIQRIYKLHQPTGDVFCAVQLEIVFRLPSCCLQDVQLNLFSHPTCIPTLGASSPGKERFTDHECLIEYALFEPVGRLQNHKIADAVKLALCRFMLKHLNLKRSSLLCPVLHPCLFKSSVVYELCQVLIGLHNFPLLHHEW